MQWDALRGPCNIATWKPNGCLGVFHPIMAMASDVKQQETKTNLSYVFAAFGQAWSPLIKKPRVISKMLGTLWINFLLVHFICFHLQWDNELREPSCATALKIWFDKLTSTSFWYRIYLIIRRGLWSKKNHYMYIYWALNITWSRTDWILEENLSLYSNRFGR